MDIRLEQLEQSKGKGGKMEITVNADSIVRMQEIKKTPKGLASFNITEDMQKQMGKNGSSFRDGVFGNLYHGSITGEMYVIVTTDKPEGWDDPSVEKVVKKKKKK